MVKAPDDMVVAVAARRREQFLWKERNTVEKSNFDINLSY